MDRSDATALLIYTQPGANSLAVEHEVLSAMKDLKREFPQGVDYKIIYDPTTFIAKSVREVVLTIFIAILLVLGVVFLFLQNWRASIIPVIAIPVSLVGTFAILYPLGISLNNLRYLAWFSRSASSSTTQSLLSKTSSATCAPACRRRMPLTRRWTKSVEH